jgi:hypothetical protein
MSTVVERLELVLTGNARDALTAIRQTRDASVELDETTGQVQKRMGTLGAAAQTAGAHIQQNLGTYGVMAVGALAAAGAASIDAYTSLADKVRDFSRASGLAADPASRLVAIFDDLGVKQGTADTGFFRLNRSIADGSSNLDDYGVRIVRARDGTVDMYGTLLNIADAYDSARDGSEKAALVQEAFGRAGKDLIPILEKGRDGLREMYEAVPEGQILNQDELDRAREFQLAVDDLSDAFQELKIAAGSELVPELTGFISYSADAIRTANQGSESIMGFAGGIAGPLRDAFTDSIPVIGPTVGLMRDLGGVFGWGKGQTDQYADAQKRLAEAQKEVARLAADESSSQAERTAAQREYNQAKADYEGVVRRVNDALGENTNKILENQAAANQYINAQLGVQGAQLNVEAATKRYNETLAENGADALETRQAAQNLEQQMVALGTATFNAQKQAGASTKEASEAQINALMYVMGTLAPDSPLLQNIQGYIDHLNGIPRRVMTSVEIRSQLAQAGYYFNGREVVPIEGAGAEGAIVNRPTIALIGEAGPEALIPLNRLSGNEPLPSGGAPLTGGVQRVVLSGGPPGFVEWVVDEINKQSRGGPVLLAAAVG